MDEKNATGTLPGSHRTKLSLKRRKMADTGRTGSKDKELSIKTLVPKLKSKVRETIQETKIEESAGSVSTGEHSSKDPHKSDDWQNPISAEEENSGMGNLFFCHICQKDITRLNTLRRQQHLNRCCDGKLDNLKQDFLCLLCQKKFSDEEVKNVHLKSCAKKRDISTAKLLDMIKSAQDNSKLVTTKNQTNLKRRSDDDFQMPPPPLPLPLPLPRRNRKRKKVIDDPQLESLQSLEEEQLQLALAMSASLNREDADGGDLHAISPTTFETRGKKRRKDKDKVPPLLTTTSQQSRDIIALRAEQLLRPSVSSGTNHDVEDEIPCTPAFGTSNLAQEIDHQVAMTTRPSTSTVITVEDEILFCSDDKDEAHVNDNTEHAISLSVVPKHREESLTLSDRLYNRGVIPSDTHSGVVVPSDTHSGVIVPSETHSGVIVPSDAHSGVVVPSDTDPLKNSFADEHKDVAYPTLWQLGSCELTSSNWNSFYVPALSRVVTPPKSNPLSCKYCCSDLCRLTTTSSLSNSNCGEMLAKGEGTTCKSGVSTLVSDLRSMINSSLFSDVTILTCNGSGVSAHSCILAARCPGFARAIRRPGPKLLDLSEFASESILGYLEYIYTGSVLLKDNQTKRDFEAIAIKMSSGDQLSRCVKYGESEVSSIGTKSSCSTLPVLWLTLAQPVSHTVAGDDLSVNQESFELPKSNHSFTDECLQTTNSEPCDLKVPDSESLLTQNHEGCREFFQPSKSNHDNTAQVINVDQDSSPVGQGLLESNLGYKDECLRISVSSSGSLPLSQQDPFGEGSDMKDADDMQEVDVSKVYVQAPSTDSDTENKNDIFEDIADRNNVTGSPKQHCIPPAIPFTEITPKPIAPNPVRTDPALVTPAPSSSGLISDDNMTPTPHYHDMQTPQLKVQCSRYGLKVLPKHKMISKLKEIYVYTHPLVAEDGSIIPEIIDQEIMEEKATDKKINLERIKEKVKEVITSDKDLYQDILLYKPLEISLIQTKLKSAGLSVAKEKLRDILDFMICRVFLDVLECRPHVWVLFNKLCLLHSQVLG